ncbi:MAG: HEAT repeat domain-containing protein, partial [Chlamydiia bacterium]
MQFYKIFPSFALILFTPLLGINETAQKQILHLTAIGEVDKAITSYLKHSIESQEHSIDILEQIGVKIIQDGFKTHNPETCLLSLFGANIARLPVDRKFLSRAFRSPNPMLQSAALQTLSMEEMDDTEFLLKEGVKSDFLMIRLETLYQLVGRHAKHAMGLVESLRNILHPQLHFFFPEFYALDGTDESINYLKQLTHDPSLSVRVSSILSSVKYDRDTLLPVIRSVVTHPNPLEQEVSAFALGKFRDIESKSKLERLIKSNSPDVKLAGALALLKLGFFEYKQEIIDLVKKGHPFAIAALGEVGGGREELRALLQSPHHMTRYRAARALLQQRDPTCLTTVVEMLVTPTYDLNLVPFFSPARTHSSFESYFGPIKEAELKNSIAAFTHYIKESMLIEALDLGEPQFLNIATTLISLKKSELIPTLVRLLENLHSKEAVDLLRKSTQQPGAPFIRSYANLAMYRLGNYKEFDKSTLDFIKESVAQEMISFQPMDLNPNNKLKNSTF